MVARHTFPFIAGRADPSIVRWNDQWLFIATDERFADHPANSGLLLRSAGTIDDLTAAEDHQILAPNETLVGCFWAPELHLIGGRLRCLFAPSIGTADWTGVQCWLMTLEDAARPHDPAAWSAPQPVLDRDGRPLQLDSQHPGISLDMTYFRVGGRSYLCWSQRFTTPSLGDAQLWLAEISEEDPARLRSAAALIASPEFDWERSGANVVEAPYALVRNDTVYLTYSASAVGPNYAVGLLTADAGSDLLDPASWSKRPEPVLRSDVVAGEWGPGHSMFTTDEKGADLFVYHALPSPTATARDTGVRSFGFHPSGELLFDLSVPPRQDSAR